MRAHVSGFVLVVYELPIMQTCTPPVTISMDSGSFPLVFRPQALGQFNAFFSHLPSVIRFAWRHLQNASRMSPFPAQALQTPWSLTQVIAASPWLTPRFCPQPLSTPSQSRPVQTEYIAPLLYSDPQRPHFPQTEPKTHSGPPGPP